MDCDGTLSTDDCDDYNPNAAFTANDADCDGTITADDCDDNNPNASDLSNDADCDGVLTSEDCDDLDPTTINDMDCDGTLSTDDCDDYNPNASDPSNDADCDGYTTIDDCDDNDPLAFDNNALSAGCAAYSCLEILNDGHSTGDGTYWIDPSGSNPIQAICDMNTEGGGYTYYGIVSGITTSRATDNNSCIALGMDIVYPRSQDHWDSMLTHFDSSYFATIPGVYKTSSSGNFTYCAMNSSASYCGTSWRVGDGGRWWLRGSTYTEPNGDYSANCWLGMRSVASSSNITFNDANCNYSTSSYVCSTNDKD